MRKRMLYGMPLLGLLAPTGMPANAAAYPVNPLTIVGPLPRVRADAPEAERQPPACFHERYS